jgi:hypothetical protein
MLNRFCQCALFLCFVVVGCEPAWYSKQWFDTNTYAMAALLPRAAFDLKCSKEQLEAVPGVWVMNNDSQEKK